MKLVFAANGATLAGMIGQAIQRPLTPRGDGWWSASIEVPIGTRIEAPIPLLGSVGVTHEADGLLIDVPYALEPTLTSLLPHATGARRRADGRSMLPIGLPGIPVRWDVLMFGTLEISVSR